VSAKVVPLEQVLPGAVLGDNAEHAGGRVPPLSDIAYNRLGLSVAKLKQVMAEVSRDFEPVRQALSI
jgi:hypothetical protein